jgi:hypothetical protein
VPVSAALRPAAGAAAAWCLEGLRTAVATRMPATTSATSARMLVTGRRDITTVKADTST